MIENLNKIIKSINTEKWKPVKLEYGTDFLTFNVPKETVEISMKEVKSVPNPIEYIKKSIKSPIHSPTLDKIIASSKKGKNTTVAITVSDITRPVPYRGDDGILKPLLLLIKSAGIKSSNISIIVGTGTHRASTYEEKLKMFGEDVVKHYKIIDHIHNDKSQLLPIGKTSSGTEVFVNKHFASADIRIATGLVESHFMAGFSGGPKAVCPGLVDLKTIEKFHSPQFLESPNATNLVIDGNPCYIEALDVAKKVGIHFLINVTLNKEMKITGVYAGDLEKAHKEAVKHVISYVSVPIKEEFDIVITHSGYVGRNHYQTAKCAVSAKPAVKKGGIIIIAANNCDPEHIGDSEYKTLIHLLKLQGAEGYIKTISQGSWIFIKDQWQPEMWAHTLRKVGMDNLIYCTTDISREQFNTLPAISGYEFISDNLSSKANTDDEMFLNHCKSKKGLHTSQDNSCSYGSKIVSKMVENALLYSVYSIQKKENRKPSIAVIKDGPYCIPVKK